MKWSKWLKKLKGIKRWKKLKNAKSIEERVDDEITEYLRECSLEQYEAQLDDEMIDYVCGASMDDLNHLIFTKSNYSASQLNVCPIYNALYVHDI